MNVQLSARDARVKTFEATTAAALEADIRAWVSGLTSERLLGVEYQSPAANQHSALILYTR